MKISKRCTTGVALSELGESQRFTATARKTVQLHVRKQADFSEFEDNTKYSQ